MHATFPSFHMLLDLIFVTKCEVLHYEVFSLFLFLLIS